MGAVRGSGLQRFQAQDIHEVLGDGVKVVLVTVRQRGRHRRGAGKDEVCHVQGHLPCAQAWVLPGIKLRFFKGTELMHLPGIIHDL